MADDSDRCGASVVELPAMTSFMFQPITKSHDHFPPKYLDEQGWKTCSLNKIREIYTISRSFYGSFGNFISPWTSLIKMVIPKTIIVSGISTKTGNSLTLSTSQNKAMNVNIVHPDVFEPAEAPRKRRRLTHLTPEERMMRR